MIQLHFNWTHISAIAALSSTNFPFRLHEGSVRKDAARGVPQGPAGHTKQPLLINWDILKAHHSKLVREYLESTAGDVQVAFLPAYSPDLNPVEFLWAWIKRHALANFCPDSLDEPQATARAKLKSAEHRPSIINACWAQAGLA